MRKASLAALAALTAFSGLIVWSAAPAGAAGVVDLSAAVQSNPTVVSPSGALVLYTATFKNDGLIPVDAVLTDQTTNGGKFVAVQSGGDGCAPLPASGAVNPVITCHVSLAAGATKVLEVVIKSPTVIAVSTITNVARADVDPGAVDIVDINGTNDEATASTTVVPGSSSTQASGFVREGETLTWRKHVLTVLDAELGIVATLKDTVAPQTLQCGEAACKAGLHADYDQDPKFFGKVEIAVNFGSTDPCKGYGAPKCYALYWRKGTAQPQPLLPGGQQGPNDPYLDRVVKQGSNFIYYARMDTNDPDLLEPIKSLTSGTNG